MARLDPNPHTGPNPQIAIAGAGCAGLSLAVELMARVPGAAITIFDPQQTPAYNKTWCSWETQPHRFAEAISTRWSRVIVRSAHTEAVLDASPHSYACVRAEDFYRLAGQRLADDRCSVRRGTGVESITEHPGGVGLTLRYPDGTETRENFDIVFDGRPPNYPIPDGPREPMLLQHFGGVELSVKDPSFDPRAATLMDFDVPQHDGAHFMYVLPFARDRVLVESTFMTPSLTSPIDYEANALSYARTKLGIDSADVVYREAGVLPMTLRPLGPPSTSRVWRIGTRAGISRASSGYAFDAIQRDSTRVVDALTAGRRRPPPPRPHFLSALDRVLLSWLTSDASAATRVFPRLFGNAPPHRLIRFLADIPHPLDYPAVMWAMPKAELIRHVLAHPSAWPGRRL
jgi:lycopene beta-cyclase